MDRSKLRFGSLLAALAVLAGVVLSAVGCRSVLTTMAYLIRGTDAEA